MTKHAQRLSEYFFYKTDYSLSCQSISVSEREKRRGKKKKKQTVLKLFKDLTSFILQLGDVHRDSNLKD